jgi:hypothetical protein
MRRARLILLFLSLLVPRLSARAQWQAAASAGASRLKQGTFGEATAATIGANADYLGDFSAFRIAGLGSRAAGDRWTGQGQAIATAFTPSWHLLSAQTVGVLGVFSESNDLPTTSADAAAQLRFGDQSRALSVGGGIGQSHRGGLSAVRSFVDGNLSWYHEGDGLSLAAALGWRGQEHAAGSEWHAVDATAWMSPHAGVNLSLGRSPEDVVRGVPGARYVTVALRVTTAAHVPLLHREAPGVRVAALRVGSEVRIDVSGVGGARVEMMADFTEWQPVPLVRDGDVWRVTRAITPGLHRIALRVDGGEWLVPRNLPRSEDELVGAVGLINVP